MTPFLQLLLAHLIATFGWSPGSPVNQLGEIKGKHLLVHSIWLAIALIFSWSTTLTGVQNLINMSHSLIIIIPVHCILILFKADLLKAIEIAESPEDIYIDEGMAFCLNEILHVVLFGAVCYLLWGLNATELINIIPHFFNFDVPVNASISLRNLFLFLCIAFIWATSAGSELIRCVIGLSPYTEVFNEGKMSYEVETDPAASVSNKVRVKQEVTYNLSPQPNGKAATGKMIGFIERFLVISIVIMGLYQAIGFIIAAKTFARFRQLDNREMAEYYITGTLLSMLIALVIGAACRQLFHIPVIR